jgi:hypothetical protein
MRNRFAFDAIQALAGGPLSFTEVHQAIGCTGRTASRTLKAVVADGSVRSLREGKHMLGGYELTARGRAVLADWSRLLAHDGEPGHGLPADPFELLGAPPYTPPVGQFVDESEFARNEDPT